MKPVSVRLFLEESYDPEADIQLVIEIINGTVAPLLLEGNLTGAFHISGQATALSHLKSPGRKKIKTQLSIAPGRAILKKLSLGILTGLKEGNYELVCRVQKLLIKSDKRGGKPASLPQARIATVKTSLKLGTSAGHELAFSAPMKGALKLAQPGFVNVIGQEQDRIELPLGLLPPRLCRVIGGTPGQQNLIHGVHEDAYLLVAEALRRFQNDQLFLRWFGPFEEGRIRSVQMCLRRMMDGFQHDTFTYNLAISGCGEFDEAISNFQVLTVGICGRFFDLPPRGPSSMAGRLVHEHSHVSGETIDSAFSEDDCLDLARRNPGLAVMNAASYQFYVGG